jgi:hypothetical protein
LGIARPEEYCYERKTAEGALQVFSVDVHSTKIDTDRQLWVESLVECKYRHDGTKWVFMPQNYGEFFGPDLADLFVTLDQCCLDRKLNPSILSKFEQKYSLCAKGIELLPDDANPKTIEQAVQQLRYAVVAKALDAMEHQVDRELGIPTPIFVVVPIIVTTAELWRLKVGMTIEDVRGAEDIAAVADTHDVLVLLQRPDNLNKRDTVTRFLERFGPSQRQDRLNDLLRQTNNNGFSFFVDYFSTYTPSLFIVISYNRIKTAMKNLHNFFGQDCLIKPRS